MHHQVFLIEYCFFSYNNTKVLAYLGRYINYVKTVQFSQKKLQKKKIQIINVRTIESFCEKHNFLSETLVLHIIICRYFNKNRMITGIYIYMTTTID